MPAPYLIGLLLLLHTAGSAACCPAPTTGVLQGGTVIVEKLPADPAQDQPGAAAKPADAAMSGGSVVVETLSPEAAADAPVAAESPVARPAAAAADGKTTGKPAATVPAKAAVPPVRAPQPQKPESATPAKPQELPPLALAVLEQRLKDTSAIGLFTKLALKNQIDDLLSQIKAHHTGNGKTPLAQLRKNYDQLLLKVHDLLKNGDPSLGSAIMNSREAIWAVLADPVKFAKL